MMSPGAYWSPVLPIRQKRPPAGIMRIRLLKWRLMSITDW